MNFLTSTTETIGIRPGNALLLGEPQSRETSWRQTESIAGLLAALMVALTGLQGKKGLENRWTTRWIRIRAVVCRGQLLELVAFL